MTVPLNRVAYLKDIISNSEMHMRRYNKYMSVNFVAEYALQAAKAELLALEGPAVTITSAMVDLCDKCGQNCTPDQLDIPCFLRSQK